VSQEEKGKALIWALWGDPQRRLRA